MPPENVQTDKKFYTLIIGLLSDSFAKIWAMFGGTTAPAQLLTTTVANRNTCPIGNACNKVLIRALSTNTGIVWVNFEAEAKEGECYELLPEDVIIVPTKNTENINALFKSANDKLIILYKI